MATAKRTFITILGTALFLIISPLYLANKFWHVVILKQDHPNALSSMKSAYATVLISSEDALKELLPEGTETVKETKTLTEDELTAISKKARLNLIPEFDQQHEFTVVKAEGEIIGYTAEDTVPGKWGPIHYMIAFKPNGKIKNVLVLSYEEQRGKPVAKRRFLKQFRNKSTKNKIRFQKDIRGVTGASISSRGMADGVRKMTHVFEVAYGI